MKGLIYMTICPGTRIKHLRQLNKMSQEELGKRVGVQRAAINKYEKGTVTNIPIATIENIAKIFDVSPTYIVGWDALGGNPLSAEVKVLQSVKKFYGSDTLEIIETYTQLNAEGKKQRVRTPSTTQPRAMLCIKGFFKMPMRLPFTLGFWSAENTESATTASALKTGIKKADSTVAAMAPSVPKREVASGMPTKA